MRGSVTQEQANSLIKTLIDYEIEKNYLGHDDIINDVNKCVKHLTCLGCLDTRKILFESESWFGGTYEEFSCPACTGSRNRLDSHYQIFHCQVNGRQVPFNGYGEKIGYSRVREICEIYRREYQESDLVIEEQERKIMAVELEAENMRIENERLSRQLAEEEENNTPHWDFMDDKVFKQEINSTDVEVNISELIEDISKIIAVSAGNLAALPSFLTGVKLTFSNYWKSENSKNNSLHKLKDNAGETVYIKFEYNKIIEEKRVAVGIFRAKAIVKKQFLCVSCFIAKPTKHNKPAEKICEHLMNTAIQTVINNINRQIKN